MSPGSDPLPGKAGPEAMKAGTDDGQAKPLDPAVFDAALEAWRREHDLWRKRVERADDQAAGLLAVTITTTAAFGAILARSLDDLGHGGSALAAVCFAAFGGGALLASLVLATLTRGSAWSVPKAELARFHEINRTHKLWPFRRRGERPWSPRSDHVFLDELAVERWHERDWRGWLVARERTRTTSLQGQAEQKEKLLRAAVLTFFVGALYAVFSILLLAIS